MLLTNTKKVFLRNLKSQIGSVYAETAMIIPLIMLLFFTTTDFARWLDMRYQCQRVAYEAARYGASLQSINKDKNLSLAAGTPKNTIDNTTAQGQIYRRMELLMSKYKIPMNANAAVDIAFSEDGSFGKNQNAGAPRSIRVNVTIPFSSLSPMLSGLFSIKVSADAPHLYPEI